MAAGVCSAVGLFYSNLEVNETPPLLTLIESVPLDIAERAYGNLENKITKIIGGDKSEIEFTRFADVRFKGQAYEITVSFENGNVYINDAMVTLADTEADNGVVHVIDAVLVN